VYLQTDLLAAQTEIPGGVGASIAATTAATAARNAADKAAEEAADGAADLATEEEGKAPDKTADKTPDKAAEKSDLGAPSSSSLYGSTKTVNLFRRQMSFVQGAAPDPNELPTPIILTPRVAGNTTLRVENGEHYGPEMFAEGALEVVRYLAQGSYPRFLQSVQYQRMKRRGRVAFEEDKTLLPTAAALRVRPPESPILARVGQQRRFAGLSSSTRGVRSLRTSATAEVQLFDIDDILKDGILYNEFLQRLKAVSASECLLCMRSIRVFKELMAPVPKEGSNSKEGKEGEGRGGLTGGSVRFASESIRNTLRSGKQRGLGPGSTPGNEAEAVPVVPTEPLVPAPWTQHAEDQAWLIYMFFVAKGSAYEVSLSVHQYHDILRSLGRIHVDMFWALEAAVKVGLGAFCFVCV
jgi:hypothetical protein